MIRENRPMRKLILQMQVSADGFVGSYGTVNWQLWGWGDNNFWDDELKRDFNAHFERIDTILLSRKMLNEGYLGHWENAANRYPIEPFYAFAKRITEMSKMVPTNKPTEPAWERTTLVSGDLHEVVGALKSQRGRDIGVFGGAGFAAALIEQGLVDEFQFYINPAVLGDGVRIFAASGFRKLKLLEAKAYSSGMVVSRYTSSPRASKSTSNLGR